MAEEKKHFLIIDANSVIHRAFHALPRLTTKKGESVNAVYGVLLVFFKAIKEFQPDFIAACFDLPVPTFRHQKFKEYKAKRPPTPKELSEQFPKVKEILDAFNVKILAKEGFEADDIIGTLASRAAKVQSSKFKVQTTIVSGDLDTLQLVNSQTRVYALRKGVKDIILYDENLVKEKYRGLFPGQLIDFKSLRGDPSDNIPGVKGIGEKTAIKLIKEFGSLENLYSALNQRPLPQAVLISVNQRLRAMLEEQKEQAFFSKSLVQLNQEAPIDFNFEGAQWKDYDREKATQILKGLEFYSLIARLPMLQKQDEGLKENLKLW